MFLLSSISLNDRYPNTRMLHSYVSQFSEFLGINAYIEKKKKQIKNQIR